MILVKKFYSPDDQGAAGGGETPEERAIRLETELNAEREKIKNQNSYITKLEAENRAKAQQPAEKKPVQPQPNQQPEVKPSTSRDPYLVQLQTNDVITQGLEEVRKEVGDEVFAEIKEDANRIARANIKDPSNVPEGLFGRVAEMALGRAMKDETRRIKVAGAFVNAPAQEVVKEKETVVVQNPGQDKIGTMQPGDKQGLGTKANPPGEDERKSRRPSEFLKDLRSKK